MKLSYLLTATYLLFSMLGIAQDNYIDTIEKERKAKDIEFRYNTNSPLKDEDRIDFLGLKYFPIDENYKVKATFTLLDQPESIIMKTSGTRTPEYLRYAMVQFVLQDVSHELTVYKSVKHQDDPEFKDYIFIPFRDLNSGEVTYGGGRYLESEIPEGNTLILDFNSAYNPYCAYNEKYSCVIPPSENTLEIKIDAGEKKFDDH